MSRVDSGILSLDEAMILFLDRLDSQHRFLQVWARIWFIKKAVVADVPVVVVEVQREWIQV
jgi:hypothetical protein